MTYPTAITTFTNITDGVGYPKATDINPVYTDLAAVENMLGVNGGSWIGEGQMMNGKLSVTVSANDLIVALKTIAGTDPSATDPIYVRINGTVRKVTAALSVTLADGTNWFNSGGANLATQLVGYFAYVGYRTASTAVVLGFSPIPHAKLYSDFSATTTNAKYGAFSTAPASTDNVVNIGYFEATLSAGAGYTWTVPTFTTANLIQRPTFETNWLTSTTTYPAGFTATPPTWTITYKKVMDVCLMRQLIVSEGTSTATTFTFTVPVAPLEAKFNFAPVFVKDNGTQQTVMGHLESTAGSTTISAYKSWYQGVWTNANAKNLFFNQIDYRY